MANSVKGLPTPVMSTVSAQATKRATCGEQEVGSSWFSLRQRSKFTNSLEHSCLIFWITGLSTQIYKYIKNKHPVQIYGKIFKTSCGLCKSMVPYCDDVHCATFIFNSWHFCCHVDGLEATHDPYASISLWQYFVVISMAACLKSKSQPMI